MKFLNRKRKVFKLRPEEYVKGYEDDNHPCSGCIVRPICTKCCPDLVDYVNELNQISNKIAKKWIPKKVSRLFDVPKDVLIYSNENILRYFKEIKGHQAAEIYNDDEAYDFLKKAQYNFDRIDSIFKNHTNKYGYYRLSSSATSGVSSSSSSRVSKIKTRPMALPNAYQLPMKTSQVTIPKKTNRLKIP